MGFSKEPMDKGSVSVIGLTGPVGTGKTTAGLFLSTSFNMAYLRYSEVLAEWRGSDKDGKKSLQEVGWSVMSGEGQAELNALLIRRTSATEPYVVDGLRHPIDYESLKNHFDKRFFLIYIHSDEEVRAHRLIAEGRFQSVEDFRKADQHPVEQMIPSLKAKSDVIISNNGTKDDLFFELQEALRGRKLEEFNGSLGGGRRTVRL